MSSDDNVLYHYHADTGEYLDSRNARRDPLDPTRLLIPAHATVVPPPEATPNEKPVWDRETNQWQLLLDKRGTKYWMPDGREGTIKALGEEIPGDAATTPPTPPTPPTSDEKFDATLADTPVLAVLIAELAERFSVTESDLKGNLKTKYRAM